MYIYIKKKAQDVHYMIYMKHFKYVIYMWSKRY